MQALLLETTVDFIDFNSICKNDYNSFEIRFQIVLMGLTLGISIQFVMISILFVMITIHLKSDLK